MAQHKLVIAEKPSVAQSLAAVIGATVRKDGYLEGNGWRVSWCVGHLAEGFCPLPFITKASRLLQTSLSAYPCQGTHTAPNAPQR